MKIRMEVPATRFAQICSSESYTDQSKTPLIVSVPTGASVGTLTDVTHEDRAGAFAFPADQQQIPALRNRFILWRSSGTELSLSDNSLDWNLVGERNVIVKFQNSAILDGISISALSRESIHLLVPTTSSVHRFVLRHPWKLQKLKAKSEQDNSVPSILDDFADVSLGETSNSATVDDSGLDAAPVIASSTVNSKSQAVFALGYQDSSILIVTLSIIGSTDGATKEIVRPNSAVKRLWNGLLSPFSRGPDDVSPESSLGLCLHSEEDDTLLFDVSRDQQLRVWSCSTKRMKSSLDLLSSLAKYQNLKNPVLSDQTSRTAVRKCVLGRTVFVAVFLSVNSVNEFLIFCPTARRTNAALTKVINFDAPELQLVDFELTPGYLWTLWLDSSNKTVVKYKPINLNDIEHGPWSEVPSDSPQKAFSSVLTRILEAGDDMTEIGLREVTKPGRFSFGTVLRAIKVVAGRNCDIPNGEHGNWNQLAEAIGVCAQSGTAPDGSMIHHRSLDVSSSRLNDSFVSNSNRQEWQFWKALWSSCVQINQASEKPFALLSLPEMDLYGVISKERFFVFMPLDLAGLSQINQFGMSTEHFLMEDCLERVENLWSEHESREFAKILLGKTESQIWRFSEDKAKMLTYDKSHVIEVTDLRKRIINVQHYLTDFVDGVLLRLQPALLTSADVNTEAVLPDYQRFLKSDLACGLLASGFEATVCSRLKLCRELLVLLAFCHAWKQELSLVPETWSEILTEKIPSLAKMCQSYESLAWVSELRASATTVQFVDTMRLISELSLSHPPNKVPCNTRAISEMFKNGKSAAILRNLLAMEREPQGAWDSPAPLLWGSGVGTLELVTLAALWPECELMVFPNFLVSAAQYGFLEDYCKHMAPWRGDLVYAKWFYSGLAHLNMDEPQKSYEAFVKAFAGVDLSNSVLKEHLFGKSAAGKYLASDYFLMVVNLLETKNFVAEAVKMAEKGLEILDEADKNMPKLWTVLFKNQVTAGKFRAATMSILRNPDEDMQRNCLRQLLNALLDTGKTKDLVEMNFGPLDPEVADILESRARTLDIATTKVDYYELLYSYYVVRSNFRKAAAIMYEEALRLKREIETEISLKKQLSSLSTTVSTLSLVSENYRWLVRRNEQTTAEGSESPETDARISADGSSRIVELPEIRKELILCQANIHFNEAEKRRNSKSKKRQYQARDSPAELVECLLQVDLFDSALNVSLATQLPLARLLRSLTTRCVQCVKLDSMIRAELKSGVKKGRRTELVWLTENCMIYKDTSWECGSVEKCWKFLEKFLDHLGTLESPAVLIRSVAEELLSCGWDLPAWLIDRYKKVDVSDCLRTLISYQKLDDAAQIVSNYVDAILGRGTEGFELRNSLQPGGEPVWLPYSSIEQLFVQLGESKDPETLKKSKELEKKMVTYFGHLESVCKAQWASTSRKPMR